MDSKILLLFVVQIAFASAHLNPEFYAAVCPQALPTIKRVVLNAVEKEKRMGASLLRLHFHDCFVNGCDGSVLLDDTFCMKGEKNSHPNKNSLRGFDVVDEIKSEVEKVCPGVVSCADILAVAARDSVSALGGPSWAVPLGRRDSTWASYDDANSDLPPADANFTSLKTLFSSKGLSEKDLVVLSGGHTIGKATCSTVFFRLYKPGKPIEHGLLNKLIEKCPGSWGGPAENDLYDLDETTEKFDDVYFKNLVKNKGVLYPDQELYGNTTVDALVRKYSNHQMSFFEEFSKSMIKMGNVGVLSGNKGEIRKICSRVNKLI